MIKFNNFYKFVTGIKESRFIYQEVKQPEPPKAEEAKELQKTADEAGKLDTVDDVNKAASEYFADIKEKGQKLKKDQEKKTLKRLMDSIS